MPMKKRAILFISSILACLPGCNKELQSANESELIFSRADYQEKLYGFWLAACIANWTGLVTEMDKIGDTEEHKTLPFYTSEDWGKPDLPNIWSAEPSKLSPVIDFVLREQGEVWGADDDTDIEYIYQELLLQNSTSRLTPRQIREGWLRHIRSEEENYLWVSNERALRLMEEGVLPPDTSDPDRNPDFEMIDAQLTTEIFGLFAPGRPDIALQMAHLPIRTTARENAAWISEFYVIMHALAPLWDGETPIKDHLFWMAAEARKQLPESSYSAAMYDFVLAKYQSGISWEAARDAVHQRYQVDYEDGYNQSHMPGNGCFAAGINFAASLVSLFYGEGGLKETIKIGTLAGWDSDNPTATWAGLLGFMIGKGGVEAAFPDKQLSSVYNIGRTRINFPDRTPDLDGDDTFTLMSERGLKVVDRAVTEEMGGMVDMENDQWRIPLPN